MISSQAEVNTTFRPRVTFYSGGVATDLDSGVPVVAVTRPDGTAITSPVPNVAKVAATTGVYEITNLPAQPNPTILRIDWAGVVGALTQTQTTKIEIVGEHLFGLPAFRAFRVAGGQPFALTASPLISDTDIMNTRTACLDELQHYLNFAPVPRFARETVDGDGTGQVILVDPGLLCHTPPLSVAINGAAQSTSGYTLSRSGILRATSGYAMSGVFTAGWGNVTVEYTHGWDRPMGRVSDVAMVWAAALLNPSGFSSATTVSLPTGETYSYEPSYSGREGFKRFTGVMELDRWLNSHRMPVAV